MAIYLDSANLEEARRARSFGWVHGVTTNPALLARAGMNVEETLAGLARLEFRQVFYQLVSQEGEEMLAEAHRASEILHKGLVLKVPPTESGFRFAADHGNLFPCCITAVFDPAQGLAARAAGARYLAVYVNRATRLLGSGPLLVKDLAVALAGSQTEIVAASLKSTREAVEAFAAGAQHLTLPFDLLESLMTHPRSAETLVEFLAGGAGISRKS